MKRYVGYRTNTNIRPKPKRSYSSVVRGNRRKVLSSVRRSGGKTKSRVKFGRKKKLDQGVFEERGGSSSQFSHGLRPYPKAYYSVIKSQPKFYFHQNETGVIRAGAGTQGIVSMNQTMGRLDFATINKMMAWQITNGASLTPLGYKTGRIFVKDVASEMSITNTSNYQLNLKIYDLIARRDIKYGDNMANPATAWSTGYLQEGAWDPNVVGTGNPSMLVVGSTPFTSNDFTAFWKVQKITHTKLAGGQFHTHRTTWRPRHLVDNVLQQEGSIDAMRGLTTWSLIVIYGAPAADDAGGVTVAPANVDIVNTKTYTWGWFSQNSTGYTQDDTLSGFLKAGAFIQNEAQEKLDTFADAN